MTTLEQRIAAIEDREAITDVILRHAEHVRSGTLGDAGYLFMSDAVFEMARFDPERPGATTLQERVVGSQAILDSKNDIAGYTARLWPMIHNIRIALDGDAATSTCVSMTTIWPMGHNMIGEYRDRFRRDDGTWRFAARTFVVFGSIDGTYADRTHERFQAMKAEWDGGLASG